MPASSQRAMRHSARPAGLAQRLFQPSHPLTWRWWALPLQARMSKAMRFRLSFAGRRIVYYVQRKTHR